MVNTARSYLAGVSLPFPIQGMVFVPKEMISRVDVKLEEFKGEFNSTVDEFLGDNAGLVVAEVELESADQLFDKPDWAGADGAAQAGPHTGAGAWAAAPASRTG